MVTLLLFDWSSGSDVTTVLDWDLSEAVFDCSLSGIFDWALDDELERKPGEISDTPCGAEGCAGCCELKIL